MEYHEAEPDVGILTDAYECPRCGHVELPDLQDDDE